MANAPFGAVLEFIHRIASDQAYTDMSDSGLVKRFLTESDEKAFITLLKRYGPMVLSVGRRILGNEQDAEDTFQATFLLLARKAKSIRKNDSVASWLYGVAQRLALKMQCRDANRQARERQAAEMANKSQVSDEAWQELQSALHEALAQVPEKYRAALLMCYLEGKTQEEAAKYLGCPIGTIRSRLARGRDKLQKLLGQRGLPLSATALAAAFGANNASASVAPTLVRATAKAALEYTSGQAAAALVSAKVAALLEQGLKTMTIAKLKATTAVALLVSVFLPASGGWVVYSQLAVGTVAAKDAKAANVKPAAQLPAAKTRPAGPKQLEAQKTKTISGRVLDIDGKPAGGAKLIQLGAGERPKDLGTSAGDGRFTVAVALPKAGQWVYLVARVDGAGVDFMRIQQSVQPEPIALRVVRDHAIRGRIITAEGKPVAGANVSVAAINAYPDNSLDSFLAEWKKLNPFSGLPYGVKGVEDKTGLFQSATTDADGRFTLACTGAERLVRLRIRGPGITESTLLIVNREKFDHKPYNKATADNLAAMPGYSHLRPPWLLDGPTPTVVAETDRPIRGLVQEMDSGKPRPGIKVWLSRNGDNLASPMLTTTTDAEGRFELRGARKSKSYMLEVGSDPAGGFMACQVEAEDTPGYEPITIGIKVKKGVIITGRVIDASTKKPLPGFAMAGVLRDNPFVKDYPEFDNSASLNYQLTGEDGTFRVVTVPGPVLLMGGPDSTRMPEGEIAPYRYKLPVPDPKYPQYFTNIAGSHHYYGSGGGINALQGNFCKLLHIKVGTEIVEQDIIVEPASALPVRIQDADGLPLAGTFATGVSSEDFNRPVQLKTDACSAFALEPGKQRLMAFYEPTRKLVGTLTLKGDEKEPAVVKLGPAGVVKGRLLSEDGKPLVGVIVNLHFPKRTAAQIHDYINRAKLVETDSGGAFQIEEVIPGLKFSLRFKRGVRTFESLMTLDDRSVEPGAVLSVGAIKLKLKTEEKD